MSDTYEHGHDLDLRLGARELLERHAPGGALFIVVGYCDGQVEMSSDDAILHPTELMRLLRRTTGQLRDAIQAQEIERRRAKDAP